MLLSYCSSEFLYDCNKLQIKLMKQQVHLYRVGLFIRLGADDEYVSLPMPSWNKLSVLYPMQSKG
jgi:hypothetical protein